MGEVGNLGYNITFHSRSLWWDVELDDLPSKAWFCRLVWSTKSDIFTLFIVFTHNPFVVSEVAQCLFPDRDDAWQHVPENWLGIWFSCKGASVDISFVHVQVLEEFLVEISFHIMEKLVEESIGEGLIIIVMASLQHNTNRRRKESTLGFLVVVQTNDLHLKVEVMSINGVL